MSVVFFEHLDIPSSFKMIECYQIYFETSITAARTTDFRVQTVESSKILL